MAGLIAALGLGVVLVRRRSLAIALVSAQSLALGVMALGHADELLVPAIVLVVKALALPAALIVVLRSTREPRLVAAAAGPLVRLAAAAAAAGLAAALVPADFRAGVAAVVTGLAIVTARRPVLFQLLGLIVAENGLSLLALQVPGGLSYVIELGALLDLALVVVVASFLARRIHLELGTGDTELLRGLRD